MAAKRKKGLRRAVGRQTNPASKPQSDRSVSNKPMSKRELVRMGEYAQLSVLIDKDLIKRLRKVVVNNVGKDMDASDHAAIALERYLSAIEKRENKRKQRQISKGEAEPINEVTDKPTDEGEADTDNTEVTAEVTVEIETAEAIGTTTADTDETAEDDTDITNPTDTDEVTEVTDTDQSTDE